MGDRLGIPGVLGFIFDIVKKYSFQNFSFIFRSSKLKKLLERRVHSGALPMIALGDVECIFLDVK